MSLLFIPLVLIASVASADVFSADSSTIKILGGVVEKCVSADEMTGCLEGEAAGAVGKALSMEKISIFPGLNLVKTGAEPAATARALDTPGDKLWDNIHRLMASRSLAFELPDLGEARGKKKKVYHMLAVAAATAAAILIPIKLKAIAAVALAALMIGKLALVLASLAGLKKLVSKPSEETTHVHYDTHRSEAHPAHLLAYSNQGPYND